MLNQSELNRSDRNHETTGPNRRQVVHGEVALTLAAMAGETTAAGDSSGAPSRRAESS